MTEIKQVQSLDDVLVQVGDFGKYQIWIFSLVNFAVILHSAVHVAYVFTALDVGHRWKIKLCRKFPKNMTDALDAILDRIGAFGKYQILVFSLVFLAVIFHSSVHIAYVFTARDLNYRCALPECDTSPTKYEPSWLPNAVPYKGSSPAKCERYFYNSTGSTNENCSLANFDDARKISCDSFVYQTEEKSILQEYDLQCDENLWKLSMVGTINSIGQFVGLFIAGFIADKYGRKVILVWGMVICGVCGLVKSLMPTYAWFLAMEFLDAMFGSSTYICGFVLGVELVSPKYRVLTGIIVSSCYTLGEIFTAAAAWAVQSWKPLIYILYAPTLLLISFLWLVPESVRWNISKGNLEEAKATLRVAAKFNGKELSENTLEKLSLIETDEANGKGSVKAAFTSTTLTLRLVNCCFCWITCAFLFYGLTLNSVSLAQGNSYVDFILTSLVEIPAYISCHFMLEYLGRRRALILSFLITAVSCAAFILVPADSHGGSLTVYLLGKFGATAAFTNIYVMTSEMFPTNMRQSFMNTCSTFGRIGNMVAPQTPLLGHIWGPLPLVSFAVLSVIAALLTLLFPETANISLPNTIEEAENLSKIPKKDAGSS